MNILLVGGTFSDIKNSDGSYGKPSGLISKMCAAIPKEINITIYNGGEYSSLEYILNNDVKNADVVFWFANVDNSLPKIRNVKEINPKVMLVVSKRNDNNKYTDAELINRALQQKANLLFEFFRSDNHLFHIRILDPLGCVWYRGIGIKEATNAAIQRLSFLSSITRQPTIQTNIENNKMIEAYMLDNTYITPEFLEFIQIVRFHANTFHKLVPHAPTERMLGNCSLMPNNFRCAKGFPSKRIEGNNSSCCALMSRRNVEKSTLSVSDFVPVELTKDNQLLYYGNNKPSVDTPIQIRLYKALPNINYMIHSHCYIKNAPFTKRNIPCGGIEEVQEVLDAIDNVTNRDGTLYKINLIGHGSLIMANNVDDLRSIDYYARDIPETII